MATTKITKGKSFFRAAKYDLKNGLNKEDREKIAELPETKAEAIAPGFKKGERARLLCTNLIDGDISEIAKQFEEVAKQQPGIKEPVHKVSINIKPGEHLDTHQWLEVGKSYLKEMGYEDSPFLIAQHREKDHEHIHLLTSRVDFNGEVVSDVFEQRRARKWANKIEEKYGLIKTPEKAEEKGLSRIEIEQSMKTGKIPPKLVLQETIKKTLESYQETPDFIEALHNQNISIAVRQKEKEIIGISFGYDGRAFKGSDLGTKFTWTGLQKNGLNYEFERDYQQLEEASRRSRRTESESAGRKLPNTDGSEQSADSIGLDNRVEIGTAGSAKLGGKQRSREENEGTPIEELGVRITAGRKLSTVESISESAETDERLFEDGSAETAVGNQTEFRRFGQSGSKETETFGRIEPEIYEETIAAESGESNEAEQNAERQSEYALESEFFRELALRQQTELSENSAAVLSSYEASWNQVAGNELSIAPTTNPPAAGTGTADVAGDSGISDAALPLDDVVFRTGTTGSLDNDQGILLADDCVTGTLFHTSAADWDNFSSNSGNVGFAGTNESGYLDKEESEDFSTKFRDGLDYAETAAKKTIEIKEDLEKEEIEKAKLEELDIKAEKEFELEMTLSL
jgi:hypothetical protein